MTEPWLPGNDVDAELVNALAVDDRRRFSSAIRHAPWYLPALPKDARGRQYLTRDLFGETYLLVFTSVPSLAATVGGVVAGCVVTGYDELQAHWPEPSWRLAVNPGTPIDAWVRMDVLDAAAAGTGSLASLASLAKNPTSAATDAVLDEFLSRLNTESLLVPVASDAPFSFRPAEHAGAPAIEVFTSAEALHRRHSAGVATTTRTMPALLSDWPGDTYTLVIDAGTDASLAIPGDQVHGLLLWSWGGKASSSDAAGSPRSARIVDDE